MHLNSISLYMNDFVSIFLKDISSIVDKLIDTIIIESSFDKSMISIDYLSKSKQGDISTNLLIVLRKFLINKNFNLNNNLYQKIQNLDYVNKIEIAKAGFINIFFDEKFLIDKLSDVIKEENNYGQNDLGQESNVNIEFVSANPTGPIHIAHIRGAVYGDVLANILEKTGHKVTREFYVNDAGSQITILGNSLYKRYQQLRGKKIDLDDGEYPGKYLIKIAENISSKDKDKWLSKDEGIRNKYFRDYAVKEILNSIKNDLEEIDIYFDKFSFETEIIKQNKIVEVIKILKKKDLLYEGTLEKPKGEELRDWEPRRQLLFRSSNFNDDRDRSFQKANGDWTYFANDVAYHYDKITRNFNQLINIWGADHIGYIKRMKSIVDVISNKKNFLDIRICQIVRLLKNDQVLKMSKREGIFVTLREIFNLVGKDSLRYYMISTKNETSIDFDVNKVIEKNKNNPVFYCQYAYARASSVINKALNINEFNEFKKQIFNFDINSVTVHEREIILKIISWPHVLIQSAILKQPHKITNFIEDLSAHFHSFWNKGKDDQSLRLIDTSNPKKTITKLLWVESMRIVLKNAFQIIGIEALAKM